MQETRVYRHEGCKSHQCNVDSQRLANAIVRLQSVRLNTLNTWLTTDQVNAICRTIIGNESLTLEDLRLPQYSGVAVDENIKDKVREKVKNVMGL